MNAMECLSSRIVLNNGRLADREHAWMDDSYFILMYGRYDIMLAMKVPSNMGSVQYMRMEAYLAIWSIVTVNHFIELCLIVTTVH